MPCFSHTGPQQVSQQNAGVVLLKAAPPAIPDGDVAVFRWLTSSCDCSAPDSVRFSHAADLRVSRKFISEDVCRDATGGRELLYTSLVKRNELDNIRPAPPGSGC